MIIGLDIATKTGVAVGCPGERPTCWAEVMGDPGGDHAARFAQSLRLAHRLIRDYSPEMIAIEAPLKRRHDKTSTNMLLMGMAACVIGMARDRGVQTSIVQVSTLDQHFLGGRVKGSAARKAAISDRVKALGWTAPSQDAADAAAVWSWACSQVSSKHGISTTPLFSGR